MLLALSFFVCSFQVVFIATHVPAFLADKGLSAGVGSMVLAFIGLLNIPGTYFAGLWGGRFRKPIQLGAFLGGWLGGVLYDRLGTYDGAWSLAIGLSFVAALLNLPIKEQPLALPEPGKA